MVVGVLLLLLAATDAEYRCADENGRWLEAKLYRAPCRLLEGVSSVDAGIERVMIPWDLTEAQARCAVEASLRPEHNWRTCVEQWPGSRALWGGFLLAKPGDPDVEELMSKLGADEATRLLGLSASFDWALVTRVLRVDPSRALALLRDRRLSDAIRFELGVQAMEQKTLDPNAIEWRDVIRAQLDFAIATSRPLLAAAVWLKLPGVVRAAMTSELEWTERVQLALGLAALGERNEARTVAPSPLSGSNHGMYDEEWDSARRALVSPGDLWDQALDLHRAAYVLDSAESCVAVLSLVPKYAAVFERPCRRYLLAPAPTLRSSMEAETATRAASMLQALLPTRAAPAGLRLAPLAPSPATPFSEVSTQAVGPRPRVLDAASLSVPSGFTAVRAERAGRRTVVLALSQDLDPTGEVTMGGWWLLLTDRPGGPWRTIYLGLRHLRPWAALARSEVPLVDAEDVVRLTMAESPLVEESITFPPMGLATRGGRARVVLSASLAALERDTDGDGLTDLVEDRLLLDPTLADTDWDGLGDAEDPAPRLHARAVDPSSAALLEAVLQRRRPGELLFRKELPQRLRTRFLVINTFIPASVSAARLVTLSTAELEEARARFGAFYPMDLYVVMNGPDHAFVEVDEGWRGYSVRVDRDEHGRVVVTELSGWVT